MRWPEYYGVAWSTQIPVTSINVCLLTAYYVQGRGAGQSQGPGTPLVMLVKMLWYHCFEILHNL